MNQPDEPPRNSPHRPRPHEFEDAIHRLRTAEKTWENDLPTLLDRIGGPPAVAAYGAFCGALEVNSRMGIRFEAHTICIAALAVMVEFGAKAYDLVGADTDESSEQKEIRWRQILEDAGALEAHAKHPTRDWIVWAVALFLLSWEVENELQSLQRLDPPAPPAEA
jgi:hypothetical protein